MGYFDDPDTEERAKLRAKLFALLVNEAKYSHTDYDFRGTHEHYSIPIGELQSTFFGVKVENYYTGLMPLIDKILKEIEDEKLD